MNSIVLSPGEDFCKVLRGTNGQQVLLALDPGEDGEGMVVGTACFMYKDQPLVCEGDMQVEPALCQLLVRQPLTAKQELELADRCIRKLATVVLSQLD